MVDAAWWPFRTVGRSRERRGPTAATAAQKKPSFEPPSGARVPPPSDTPARTGGRSSEIEIEDLPARVVNDCRGRDYYAETIRRGELGGG